MIMTTEEIFVLIIEIIAAFIMTIAIFRQPYMGLVFTIASQPIAIILPQISIFSSIVPIIGLVTIFAFLIKARNEKIKGVFRFSSPHLLALLLIFWILITHPNAAWFGADRNWIFTYLQLWVLMWLTGFLLDTPRKHHVLMWVFSLCTLISAAVIVFQSGVIEEIDPTNRASGLSPGANTAARYFVISFIFLYYLNTITKKVLIKLIAIAGLLISFLGVFYTVSRTGILLLGISVFLLFLLQSNFKNRTTVLLVTFIAFSLLMVFSSSILDFVQGIVPSISQGTDTVGLRYALWEAGWEMFKDHPISGVGIGKFPMELRNYPNPSYSLFFRKGLVAHNMYVSMLAETGIIGLTLFMSLIIATLANLIKSRKRADPTLKSIANVWLIVLIIILVGGITKTDQVDKLFWLSMGTSIFLTHQLKVRAAFSKQNYDKSWSASILQKRVNLVNTHGK